ncbi:uncharacterized protein LOC102803871 [Saccoglossus kowalevskii]|uniref:Uncharacterized protein LOC102803871 n=1 Tax=Saccoglossus kowalevskii TaxID=10224 RepID=A0ABM0LXK7_SACKO|nr:PREDICTED: uncharacterized protein LOC102803871 [Saccoglossus kowalevskii]
MIVELYPSEILYLQDSISPIFNNGIPMLATFRDLLYGDLSVDDIRTISVFQWDVRGECQWYVHSGHRRLYMFKRLQKQGVVDTITAWELHKVRWGSVHRKNNSTTGGKSVVIRNDKSFVGNLGNIIKRWKNQHHNEDYSQHYETVYYDTSSTSSDDYYYYRYY